MATVELDNARRRSHGTARPAPPAGPRALDGPAPGDPSPEIARPGNAAPDDALLDTAGALLRALAAPARMAIVLRLRERDCCVHDLVDALALPQPLVSQHLRVLKTAGVVLGQRDGREVRYHLVDEHLAHIVTDAIAHADELLAQAPTAGDEGAS
ncbi:ArsR/SmtB family transcription factor [Tomitella fengzijianii]|uniref:Helix-turn-helix transcriptional regulator n=1 Tax=Tomitella fengzijianii TaxID=2597660 RepID=A0A516X4K1_9ACTN|nr:metalloregulator ArsR/SmtB family transcription factor [Tomitella fengzijianii]QDQ98008.1 helix-turn-helix transcriptional regulator [Tomitella fengzijianii]